VPLGGDGVWEDSMSERSTATTVMAAAPVATGRADLRRTTVRDVMTSAVVSVSPGCGFEEVARALQSNGVRAMPVLDADGYLLGVVSEADLMGTAGLGDPQREAPQGRWHRGGGAWDRPDTASGLMTSPVVSVVPSASVAEAARAMRQHGLGWLPVVETTEAGAQRLVGVLGRSDLLAVFLRGDTDLREEIVDNLLTQVLLIDPDQIEVRVSRGVVTLLGQLPTRAEARLVTEFVERLEGVVKVIHQLTYPVDERVADATTAPPY
jgi:CBS domain-containing protein